MAPKDYVLVCKTMTCSGCEKSVQDALKKIPGVHSVKADARAGTITVVADCSSCGQGGKCNCCKCDPCNCDVCRCCACGVDKYIAALDSIGHSASYPRGGSGGGGEVAANFLLAYAAVASLAFFFGMAYGKRSG